MRVFVHDDFWDHPKLHRAALILKADPTLVGGCVVRLWCWAMRYRQDGNLSGLEDAELAAAAGCPTNPAMVAALRTAGFIDADGSLHDWHFWQGALLSKVLRDRERNSATAEKRKTNDRATRTPRKRDAHASNSQRPTAFPLSFPTALPTTKSESNTHTREAVPEVEYPTGPGWSPNRDAVHIAQRWASINAKGICSPQKASQHFQAALDAGVDKHLLMRAVEKHRGHQPFAIADAMIPKMDRANPAGLTQEERDRESLRMMEEILARDPDFKAHK